MQRARELKAQCAEELAALDAAVDKRAQEDFAVELDNLHTEVEMQVEADRTAEATAKEGPQWKWECEVCNGRCCYPCCNATSTPGAYTCTERKGVDCQVCPGSCTWPYCAKKKLSVLKDNEKEIGEHVVTVGPVLKAGVFPVELIRLSGSLDAVAVLSDHHGLAC